MLRPPWGAMVMTKEFFEKHYAMLSDKADAIEVFGNGIQPKVATVGDIRRKLVGHTKEAMVYAEPDGAGFSIADVHAMRVAGWR